MGTRTGIRRLTGFIAALGVALSLTSGVADAADRAAPNQQQTRDWDQCSLVTCFYYEWACWLSGGTSETWEDGQGGYMTSCKEKK
jgi:hypothetical protein